MNKLLDNTVSVFRASTNHLDHICELEIRIFPPEDQFPRRNFRYLLSSPNAAFFLAGSPSRYVAYGIALKNILRNGKTKGRIYSIGVVPGLQGKGIGSLLLKRMEQWLIASGVEFITLETRKGPQGAKQFFERFGYKMVEILPKYYGHADGLRMKKLSGKG